MARSGTRPDPATGAEGPEPAGKAAPDDTAVPAGPAVESGKKGRDGFSWLILLVPVIAICFPLLLRRACGE